MYLNYTRTYYNNRLHTLSDGTHAFFDPTTYAKTKSGLSYPPFELAKKVRLEDLPACSGKTAFILAGGNVTFAGANSKEKTLPELTYEYKIPTLTITQIIAHQEAKRYDNVQRISVDSSACASSLFVLEQVKFLLEHKGYARVIVLALEDTVNGMSINFFKQAGVQPSAQVSAFDAQNFGFYLGQGAVTAVFENTRTDQTLAELVAVNSASEDCSNSLGMREDGQGYTRAMEGLDADLAQVSVVKTHGTGTATNNQAERTALFRMLSRPFVATSLKPTIGHTLGASGLLESVLLLDTIKTTGYVPAIANRTQVDDIFLSEEAAAPPHPFVLSLAAGMGNIYTSALWKIL